MLRNSPHPPPRRLSPFRGTPAAAALLLAAGILIDPSPARSRVTDTPPLPMTLLAPHSSPRPGGAVEPSVYAAAAQETVYFGGTFWNPDSARWEALRDSAWTFDTGVGSSIVPPGGTTYPGVNRYKQPGLHQTMEGWIGIDNTYSDSGLPYFRRLSAAETPCVGAGAGLGGSWSFYAGVVSAEAHELCYVAGAGYGNNWDICIGKSFTWTGGQVHLTFKYRNDSEPNYDFTNVVCDTSGTGDGNVIVTAYDGPVSGAADLTLIPGVTLPTTAPRDVVIKFCVTSDELYSDEDGGYATNCGMFALDDVALSGGIVQPPEDFESGDGGWALFPALPGPGGDWSNLVSLADLPPTLSPCACALRDSVLVFEDTAVGGHGPFQNNLAASPWIDLKGAGYQAPGKLIRADVYAELPLLNYIFAQFEVQWYPELCLNTGKLMTSRWTSTGFVFYFGGSPNCLTVGSARSSTPMDFSAFVPAGAEEMRIAVGMISYCRFFAGCTNVTNSTPWFDRIALGVYGTPGAPYLSARRIDLPQDSFPLNGTININAPGRVDCNTVKGAVSPERFTSLGDTLVVEGNGGPEGMEVRVQFAVRPGPGINTGAFQSWLGRHRYEETSRGLDWYSARMDTAEQGNSGPVTGVWMTAYHEEDPNFTGTDRDLDPNDLDPYYHQTRLKNDIFPDNLLTPGSRLMLFYKAHYLGSPIWYLLPDTTGGNAFEMEVLPSSMNFAGNHNVILYVDHGSEAENDGLVERALALAHPGTSENFEHTLWDRYDVRAAESRQASFGRPLSSRYGASLAQVFDYRIIIWDTGNLSTGCLTGEDGDVLVPWLTYAGPDRWDTVGLYLAGDGLATSAIHEQASEPSADRLLTELAGIDLKCSSFRSTNCPPGAAADPVECAVLAPTVGARVAGRHRPADHLAQGNGCPDLRRFDVLTPSGDAAFSSPVPDERYEGSVKAANYASMSTLTESAGSGPDYKTVVDGVSIRHRRDPGACAAGIDDPSSAMVQRLLEVLTWFGRPDSSISGIDPVTPYRTALSPVAPNPVRGGSPIHLAYSLAHDGPARIAVYDMAGRRVREVFSGPARAGDNEALWDLRDDRGKAVAAGVYFYRLEAGGFTASRKLVVATP